MKQLVLVLLIALLVVPTANAGFFHLKRDAADRLEGRIVAYRFKHIGVWTFPGFINASAVIMLQKANYHEHEWSTSIGGVPYTEWANAFFVPPSAMLITRRCQGRPYTPRMVMKRWIHMPAFKTVLLSPPFTKIGVRAGDIRQGKGAWKGKGTCRLYYVSLSAF